MKQETQWVSLKIGKTILSGENIGINTFGESAPGKDVAHHFGLYPEKICDLIINKLKGDK